MFRKKKTPPNNRSAISSQPSAPVFSYYSSRSPNPNERETKAPNTSAVHWAVRLPSIIATIAIFASCIYVTSLNIQPKIQIDRSSKGLLLRDDDFYQKAGAKLLSRSVFNRSKLTIDTTKVAHELEATYPELGHVAVVLPLVSRRPVINIEPAQATLKLTSTSGTYIIDDQGRALIKDTDVTSSVTDALPNIVDGSGLNIEIGKQVLPLHTIDFISQLWGQLETKQVHSQNITLPAVANELHLHPEGQKYFVKFDIQGDPRQQAGAFLATKEKLETDKNLPSEYIDVRVPEKAFYK